ncbi:hypothetical protein P691DRAFT_656521 [Macrolepiota fuliginosa MF-IS2]|uniref:RING-type domain-containing protein n=1 Tax=Macrolepiota fuliginosa MF-IS2 TaxID=1400762 RepID=A0A9P5XNW7_9AGAR|nr:hypothetical protein P691DRAFT_656521 [Macrolepiota fuliginosa MF-IS2]
MKRRKIPKKDSLAVGAQSCATECGERTNVIAGPSVLSKPNFRRSSRITASDLTKRERNLLLKEQEYRLRIQQLDERMSSLLDREDEAAAKLSQLAKKEAQNVLGQLEEHFTCALCYEIMAYPYTLNPGQCGHTFCAICILKWFFSRLHRVCGGWHEAVDCPICRSVLVITPDHVPRPPTTFPFVPNRVATAVVESLVEKLARSSPPVVKQEDPEALRMSETDKEGRKQKREVPKLEDDCSSEVDLDAWREGGSLRIEWLKRDSDGKREMNNIVRSWSTLGSNDFLLLKQRLEV